MTKLLRDYSTILMGADGHTYHARAYGAPMDDGRWEAWIEFLPDDSHVEVLISARETTQPNPTDAVYWAFGLSPIYLEGALNRALYPGPLSATPHDSAGANE